MPLLLFVSEENDQLIVCVSAITENEGSIARTDVMTDALIEQGPYRSFDFEPPSLAMGTHPEVLCCSLGTTVVVIVRRKGIIVAYELGETGLELIAQENVGHYVVDAVMRYSAAEGGAEIVLLMSDSDNRRDGRVGTCTCIQRCLFVLNLHVIMHTFLCILFHNSNRKLTMIPINCLLYNIVCFRAAC